jgi:O-antigen/teichoic acid export membrane protein
MLRSPRSIFNVLAANAVEIGTGFGLILFVTRTFSMEEAGIWSMYMAAVMLSTKFREGFLHGAMVKTGVSASRLQEPGFLTTTLLLALAAEVPFVVTGAVLFWFIPDAAWSPFALLYALHGFPWAAMRWLQQLFQARLETSRMLRVNLVFLAALVPSTVVVFAAGLPLAAVAVSLGVSASLAFAAGLAGSRVRFQRTVDRSLVRDIVAFGRFGLLRELSGTLASRTLLFLSGLYVSLSAAAIIGLAQRYIQLLALPNAAVAGLLYPKYCARAGDASVIAAFFKQTTAAMLVFNAINALLLMLTAVVLIPVLHGAEYKAAVPVLLFLSVAFVLFTAFGNAFGSVSNAMNAPHYPARLVMQNSVVSIAFTWFFLHTGGMYAALLAGALTEAIGLVIANRWLVKLIGAGFIDAVSAIPETIRQFLTLTLRKIAPSRS